MHYWPKPRRKHTCGTCSASAGNRTSLRFCAVVKEEGINHFLTNPNSYLRVPFRSLFCHAISKVSQTLRFLSKYSSSQMAGALLWQGKTCLKITWWCIIMPDGAQLSRFTQGDSSVAPLHPDPSNQNFVIPRIRQTFNSAMWDWLVKQTHVYLFRFWIPGKSIKSLEDCALGQISQDFSLGIIVLYPKVSNISAPNLMDIYNVG